MRHYGNPYMTYDHYVNPATLSGCDVVCRDLHPRYDVMMTSRDHAPGYPLVTRNWRRDGEEGQGLAGPGVSSSVAWRRYYHGDEDSSQL